MDLTPKSTNILNNDNHEWLGSQFGTTTAETVTLDAAAFLTAFPTGEVPAGAEISRNTTSGLYQPGTPGTNDLAGFLLQAVKVTAGHKVTGPKLWQGKVIAAKVPLGVGGAAPVQADHKFIRIV